MNMYVCLKCIAKGPRAMCPVWLKKFSRRRGGYLRRPRGKRLRAYICMCSAMRKTSQVNRTPRGFPWGRYHRAVEVNQ